MNKKPLKKIGKILAMRPQNSDFGFFRFAGEEVTARQSLALPFSAEAGGFPG
jgi:hypothetical protein